MAKSTQDKINSILSKRKSAITSEQIAERLDASEKTVRNVLGQMITEGLVEHDEYYLTNSRGRSVYGYASA